MMAAGTFGLLALSELVDLLNEECLLIAKIVILCFTLCEEGAKELQETLLVALQQLQHGARLARVRNKDLEYMERLIPVQARRWVAMGRHGHAVMAMLTCSQVYHALGARAARAVSMQTCRAAGSSPS